MRKVHICSRLFDPLGWAQFVPLPSNAEGGLARRVTRVATLNGGVAVSDRGFSEGDRTLVYRFKPVSADHNARLMRLVRLHQTVSVATADGVYESVPQSFDPGNSENRFTLLVIRKLSEG